MSAGESREGSPLRGKSDFIKKLTSGKTLCSEVNKASNNAKFLQMRRHNAFVSQLESAKQSMLNENGRAQRDMRRQLDVYKKRKRVIFRDRVLSHQQSESEDDDCASLVPSQKSVTSYSSRGAGHRVAGHGNNQPPQSAPSGGLFPAILRVPMVASEDENIHSAIQRQYQLHMHRQESLHAQILRSRVHDFCSDLKNVRGNRHSFYITSVSAVPRGRRIAFSEGTKSAKGKRLGSSGARSMEPTVASVT